MELETVNCLGFSEFYVSILKTSIIRGSFCVPSPEATELLQNHLKEEGV